MFVYSLPENTSKAEIRITNIIGENVAKYTLAANTNSLEADCSEMKNGIYFYSLFVDGNSITKKKIVITK